MRPDRQISIHSPLAGRDVVYALLVIMANWISIHSPLAGRDDSQMGVKARIPHFNPLAPRGARRQRGGLRQRQRDFNPLAPRGARPWGGCDFQVKDAFQSTRPSRGETITDVILIALFIISIHSPLAGRDSRTIKTKEKRKRFQSTRPSRGETFFDGCHDHRHRISIHSPLAGRDFAQNKATAESLKFQSTRPSRGETARRAARGGFCTDFNPLAPRGARRWSARARQSPRAFQSTRPSRGEWIEIWGDNEEIVDWIVSPREGRVD